MVQGVDYRIPMSVKTVDLGAIGEGYLQGQDNARRNALLDISQDQNTRAQETHSAQMQHLDDESRAKSIGGFALDIMPYLERDDLAGAQRVYGQRVKEIRSRGGNPSDSMELGPYLMSGDLESAKQLVGDTITRLERTGYIKTNAPEELKVGRYRQINLPDGTMATLDTATNQLTEIAEAPSIDLSVVPAELREGVSKLPREQQVNVVEKFATPQAQQDIAAQDDKNQRATQLADDTRRLVSELLSNEKGLRSAVGGIDEIFPTFSDSTRDAEATLEDLRNLLTVDNLGIMSGVLSESDIKIIRSVGANGLSGSDDRVWASLNRMAEALGVNASGGAPEGMTDNGDGTFTLPDGRKVRRKR